MSYTLEDVTARQLEEPIIARGLDGFFSHVWSVHPCATIIPPANPSDTFGPYVVTRLATRHTIIDGKMGRFPALRMFPTTNFMLAQYELLRHLDKLVAREGMAAIRAGEPYYLGLLGIALSSMNRVPCVLTIGNISRV